MIVKISPVKGRQSVSRMLEKMDSEYVSGYLCDPQTALMDFTETWTMARDILDCGRIQKQDKETLAYLVVQSFPKGLNVSDAEVHQCGMELLQKIEKHQGVVCSDVKTWVDDLGVTHEEHKYNLILFNAYIHPAKMDPEFPRRRKYNDSGKTYWQLRTWNDEIALAHGLPIIQGTDDESAQTQ